jgi:hypothetical protein
MKQRLRQCALCLTLIPRSLANSLSARSLCGSSRRNSSALHARASGCCLGLLLLLWGSGGGSSGRTSRFTRALGGEPGLLSPRIVDHVKGAITPCKL